MSESTFSSLLKAGKAAVTTVVGDSTVKSLKQVAKGKLSAIAADTISKSIPTVKAGGCHMLLGPVTVGGVEQPALIAWPDDIKGIWTLLLMASEKPVHVKSKNLSDYSGTPNKSYTGISPYCMLFKDHTGLTVGIEIHPLITDKSWINVNNTNLDGCAAIYPLLTLAGDQGVRLVNSSAGVVSLQFAGNSDWLKDGDSALEPLKFASSSEPIYFDLIDYTLLHAEEFAWIDCASDSVREELVSSVIAFSQLLSNHYVDRG